MITQEQVADLKVGDIIRLSGAAPLNGATIEGPLYDNAGALAVGTGFEVRKADGTPPAAPNLALAIVRRIERPLYMNHARDVPIRGDVARLDGDALDRIWFYIQSGSDEGWMNRQGNRINREPSQSLRLLIDGTTGQAVP